MVGMALAGVAGLVSSSYFKVSTIVKFSETAFATHFFHNEHRINSTVGVLC